MVSISFRIARWRSRRNNQTIYQEYQSCNISLNARTAWIVYLSRRFGENPRIEIYLINAYRAQSEWLIRKCQTNKPQRNFKLDQIPKYFMYFRLIVCSPDKTDTCRISNPKVNRILNNIAIRTISSFLHLKNRRNYFLHICLYTHCFPLCSLFVLKTIWSLWIFIDLDNFTTKYFSQRGNTSEWMNFFLLFTKTPKIGGFCSIAPHSTQHSGHFRLLSELHF